MVIIVDVGLQGKSVLLAIIHQVETVILSLSPKAGEVYDTKCVVENIRKRTGWMFWGSFFGREKGPCLFWEKEWRSITAASYSERIVPLMHGMVSMRQDLQVMQDNAPSHKAARTMRELNERNVTPIEWPPYSPYSPDLKPIENIWNLMNNYIQFKYPDLGEGRQRSQDELRDIVKESWDLAVDENDLERLIESMPRRIRSVYEAGGGYTKY